MSLLLNVADPLGPRSRGGCRSCAAEAAGPSSVATVLRSLAAAVAVLRGCCRCCRAGATMQDLLLQLSMQKAPEQTLVLEESHRGVHGPGDSRQDASREVGVEKTLSEVAARWLLSSGWCCSTCYRSRLTILGTPRRTFSDDPNEPPLAPSRLAHPWPAVVCRLLLMLLCCTGGMLGIEMLIGDYRRCNYEHEIEMGW